MRLARALGAAALAAAASGSLSGCGLGIITPWDVTGGVSIENHELSTHWIDEMELYLEDPDDPDDPACDSILYDDEEDPADCERGDEYAESRQNRDPNESEEFYGLRAGWWSVTIRWSDGHRTRHGVHVHSSGMSNLEVRY